MDADDLHRLGLRVIVAAVLTAAAVAAILAGAPVWLLIVPATLAIAWCVR